ncbi:MAG: AAA family ATPase [bacterium]|nr:AAA family ATPase [bacterium]
MPTTVVNSVSNVIADTNTNSVEKRNNVRRVNFKAQDDQFVSQAHVQQGVDYESNPQAKKQKKKNNISTILSVAILFLIGLSCIPAIKEVFGKNAKEFKLLRNKIETIKCPEIKRQAEEEAARPSYERSNFRIKDLITLDELRSKEEVDKLVDIDNVKKYMDDHIIGMTEAKKQVIEFLKEYNYNIKYGIKNDTPLILHFDGPPGTGKTALTKVVADALGMYYKKVPLAGVEGSASIIGFERTYSASKSGAIADGIISGKTKRVCFNFDEVDKAVTNSHNGNPVDPLLPLCDSQKIFIDKYYDVPIDVSQCIFTFTSNDINRIPEALRSRLRTIRIEPYDNDVKSKIAKLHLKDEIVKNKMEDKVNIADELYSAIAAKTVDYGGRDTMKYVESIIRKAKGEYKDTVIKIDSNYLKDIYIEPSI